MKLKSIMRASAFFMMWIGLVAFAPQTRAQEEGEPTVVDEVIAQVNNEVITLSMLRREMREAVEQLKGQGVSEQDASTKIASLQAEMIVNLINEQLLLQKGKDMNLTDEVEAEVNRRMLQVAQEQNITSIAALDEALRANQMDPAEIRNTLRKQIMKGMVFNNEVDRRVFFSHKPDELKSYYEANKAKFAKSESFDLSEIYLSLAGKSEADVRARAAQIVAQARGGADFAALAVANSEREQNGVRLAPKNKGKLGRFQISDISHPDVAKALQNLKTGEVSDPVKLDDGLIIFRVDERTASTEPTFNENRVREVMTMERAEKERTDYVATLRDDAYIKIAKEYQSSVEPLLKKKETAAPAASKEADTKKTAQQTQPASGNKQP